MTTRDFQMNTMSDVVKSILDRFSSELPWGIYLFDPKIRGLTHFGQPRESKKHRTTELYLATTIKDVCGMALTYQRTYTETSPSGMVYIAVPLTDKQETWAVLATYLATGRIGSWRRSLNRGPTVSDSVDLLKEVGMVLNTYQQMKEWLSPENQLMETAKTELEKGLNPDLNQLPSLIVK
jgi:hypothetical protein